MDVQHRNQSILPGIERGLNAVRAWESDYLPDFAPDASLALNPARFDAVMQDFTTRLGDNYPFFHPLYAGQMLKPPHPTAIIAYTTAMLINPNNHALDGGPATAQMEREAVAALAESFGFATHLGHLSASGTIANLEALWIARELAPGKAIAMSEQAHYTHARACQLLGVSAVKISAQPTGEMDIAALEEALKNHDIGTVIATLGTTALGALDPLSEITSLKAQHGFRLHVDAAYGGYYHLLADQPGLSAFQHIASADSLVVDPHKHGLQPYGCGCVIFKDPEVARIYHHDSPYTYYTHPEALHLGEISLECSRSGAAAAALWFTQQCFPLQTGMRDILQQTRRAALALAAGLRESRDYSLYLEPALDIVTYFPTDTRTQGISRRSQAIFEAGMASREHPAFLALLSVSAADFTALHPAITADSEKVTLLRSCLMKPDQLTWTPQLLDHLHRLAKS